MSQSPYITLYDTSLRDGAQARGVDFTPADKLAIAKALDGLGIDYIEGGWPGANPTDDAFFENPPSLKQAKLSAFGMTRRAGRSASNDPNLVMLQQSSAPVVCMVGKASRFQVEEALNITLDENLAMISDSVQQLIAAGKEVHFDAEHFFDGYKQDKDAALACVKAAHDAGARWVVLCDTNGGTLPHEVETIVGELLTHIDGEKLGIHCHNDTEQAVANSIAAVRAGVRQVQGTINGVGERCGNTNLMSLIPTLMLKMGYRTGIAPEKLTQLTHISRLLDERLNRPSNPHAAYVGSAAFAHKGGLHVSGMARSKASYEHIDPAQVGNQRHILVSDKAGRSNVLNRLQELGLPAPDDDGVIQQLVDEVKQRETQGYAYENAEASFALLARRLVEPDAVKDFFELQSFRVLDERRFNAMKEVITMSEATIKVKVGDGVVMTVAEGNGPVNALDAALRKALAGTYPSLKGLKLVDYKVRILTPEDATRAVTRVTIESEDERGERWTTLGVSANVIDASYKALHDSITYSLLD